MPPSLSRRRGQLWQVAVAPDDGQPQVLRVTGVPSGERAPEVDRVAAGRPQYSVAAVTTEPSALPNRKKPVRHSSILHRPTVGLALERLAGSEVGCTKDLGQGLWIERICSCQSDAGGSVRSSRLRPCSW